MRAFVLCLLAALSLEGAAAPFAVRLGETRIVLDAPAGFADTLDVASPRLRELAEALTSASNRILLFALTDGDLRRFSTGDTPDFHRYLLLATPRALERDSVGLSRFAEFAAEAAPAPGAPPKPGDLRAQLDAGPAGQATLVREIRRTPSIVSTLWASRIPTRDAEKKEYLMSTTTLMLVRGKVLAVSAYAAYRSPTDERWLLEVTQRWTEDLQRLNAR